MNPIRVSVPRLRSFYQSGFSVPLIRPFRNPLNPWELYKRGAASAPDSFFLDSLEYRPPAQNYSYLGFHPTQKVLFESNQLRLEGEINGVQRSPDLLRELRKLLFAVKTPPGFSCDFFTGGAVGYWGYELAREFDRISFRKKKGPKTPDLGLLFFRELMVFDHKRNVYFLVSWLVPPKGVSFEQAFRQAEEKIEALKSLFFLPDPEARNGHFGLLRFRPEISKSTFEKMVHRAQAYIRAGDIYQANLSQRFPFSFKGSPLRLYSALRRTNPSPFCSVLRVGDQFIASSSPELLVAKKGRQLVTRPIAGTRPSGRKGPERRHLTRELLTNEKERAEHLMLVDLERNDLGRVSEWRSVRVKDFMRVEKYARVQHLVSEITGRLRPEKDAFDVIRAMFPGGTITGCPKLRSMEIIDELEPVRRGIYTGSLGYVGFDGNLELNIVIRTLVLKGTQGHLQVGAGIVADSDPGREYEETLAKGEALAEALVEAGGSEGDFVIKVGN